MRLIDADTLLLELELLYDEADAKPHPDYNVLEAIRFAISAIEKQIPKKPRKTDSYRGMLIRVYAYACPTCGNACLEKYMNERQNTMFCWNCGQKLDWGDVE